MFHSLSIEPFIFFFVSLSARHLPGLEIIDELQVRIIELHVILPALLLLRRKKTLHTALLLAHFLELLRTLLPAQLPGELLLALLCQDCLDVLPLALFLLSLLHLLDSVEVFSLHAHYCMPFIDVAVGQFRVHEIARALVLDSVK